MDVEPLKRCICGAEVDQDECPYPSGRRTSVDGRAMYVVNCTNNECGWQCLGWGKDGARKAWNTRHSPDAGKMGEDAARYRALRQLAVSAWNGERPPIPEEKTPATFDEWVDQVVDAARAGERG